MHIITKKIIDVSFMNNLQKLDAGEDCGIDQNGIEGLNLIELNVYDNGKIIDVSFMKNLQKLNRRKNCAIDQNGKIVHKQST